MNCCFRTGFEEEQIEALLHRIEIQMKHQSTSFGLALASVSSTHTFVFTNVYLYFLFYFATFIKCYKNEKECFLYKQP